MNLLELSKISDAGKKASKSKKAKEVKKTAKKGAGKFSRLISPVLQGVAPAIGVAAIPIQEMLDKWKQWGYDYLGWVDSNSKPKDDPKSAAFKEGKKWADSLKQKLGIDDQHYNEETIEAITLTNRETVDEHFVQFTDAISDREDSKQCVSAFIKESPKPIVKRFTAFVRTGIKADELYQQNGPQLENYGDTQEEQERYFNDVQYYAIQNNKDPFDVVDKSRRDKFEEWLNDNPLSEIDWDEDYNLSGEIDLTEESEFWSTDKQWNSDEFIEELCEVYDFEEPQFRKSVIEPIMKLIEDYDNDGAAADKITKHEVYLYPDKLEIDNKEIWSEKQSKFEEDKIAKLILRTILHE